MGTRDKAHREMLIAGLDKPVRNDSTKSVTYFKPSLKAGNFSRTDRRVGSRRLRIVAREDEVIKQRKERDRVAKATRPGKATPY